MTGGDREGDVVAQADDLMRRYRSFVARAPEETGTAPPSAAPPADEDIPVLTEIVAPAPAAPDAAIDPAAIRAIVEDSLKRWIDESLLPQLLEKLEHGTRQKL